MKERYFTQTKNGDWNVIGLAKHMHVGWLEVTKRSGSTVEVKVKKVSNPFESKFGPFKGNMVAFGYIDQEAMEEQKNQEPDNEYNEPPQKFRKMNL